MIIPACRDLARDATNGAANGFRFRHRAGAALHKAIVRVVRPGSHRCVCGQKISANKQLCASCSVAAFTQRQKPDYWK